MADDCYPLYEPGARITARAQGPITGKRCVMISANRTSGPGLSDTPEGGVYQVNVATAAGRIFGVAAYTVGTNQMCPVICGPGHVVPIRAAAAIAAFQEVEVGAAGQVIPRATGVAIGVALTAAAINTDAEIKLY